MVLFNTMLPTSPKIKEGPGELPTGNVGQEPGGSETSMHTHSSEKPFMSYFKLQFGL